MKKWIPWTLLSVSVSARADKTYQQQLESIQNRQAGIDRVLKNYGRAVGFEVDKETPDADVKARPLFQIHASLKASSLSEGKLLFGKLVNRLVVGSDGSPVLVEFEEAQGFISGLRAMGVARQAGTEGRVAVELNRLLLRDGRAVALRGTALDLDGAFGLAAHVFSGKALAVAGAMASSFIAGLASGQQTQSTTALGFSQVQPTGRNAVLQGVAQTAADQSKRLIEEATDEKPVLIVDALTPVTVMVQEEARF